METLAACAMTIFGPLGLMLLWYGGVEGRSGSAVLGGVACLLICWGLWKTVLED